MTCIKTASTVYASATLIPNSPKISEIPLNDRTGAGTINMHFCYLKNLEGFRILLIGVYSVISPNSISFSGNFGSSALPPDSIRERPSNKLTYSSENQLAMVCDPTFLGRMSFQSDTITSTATITGSPTSSPTASSTKTATSTSGPTYTPSSTLVPSKTPTYTPSKSPTWTPTQTRTPFPPPITATPIPSETPTLTVSITSTPTNTQIPTRTLYPLPTLLYTLVPSATSSPTQTSTPMPLTIPSITPDAFDRVLDSLFDENNAFRIRLILFIFLLWASLATGAYLIIRRNY